MPWSPLDLVLMPDIVVPALEVEVPGHPVDCQEDECLVCGLRDCPHGDPLHYHHDGCPACWVAAGTERG